MKTRSNLKTGECILIPYKSCELRAVILNPNGLGNNKPTLGLELSIIDDLMGIPGKYLANWMIETEEGYFLKLPSGNVFKLISVNGNERNSIKVVEASDCVGIAKDLLKYPGVLKKTKTSSIIDFLPWFHVDGFYAQAYSLINRVYSDRDSQKLQYWKQNRQLGIPCRKDYSSYIHSQDRQHGKWTNVIYQGLFGFKAAEMKQIWATQAGSANIARNHIPEAMGLQAVCHCERLVVLLRLDNLSEAHAEAIRLTRKKFRLDLNSAA